MVPLTEGHQRYLRHAGFARDLHGGALTGFSTTSFADTYSPLTATLVNAAGEPLGHRSINLFETTREMPPLQTTHEFVAKYPMVQCLSLIHI